MISTFAKGTMQLQPLPLQTLALEEFVEHVINLWKNVDHSSSTRDCEKIRDVIHREVSHIFADAVTKKLLERVCRLHNHYVHSTLTKQLLQAAVHPKVRQLRLNFHDFYNISNVNDVNRGIAAFMWNDVINRLEFLTKLYISDKSNSFVPLSIPNHIVAMDVPHCDHLLMVIAHSCPMLKQLHVRDFKATPVSIDSLQSLQVLEQLNIVNSTSHQRCYGMAVRAFHSFITNLSKCLSTLSCSDVKVSDINHLDTFPHLSSLTVYGLRIDAPFSGQFTELKDLHLWGVEIYHSPFLVNLGQLTSLSLHVCIIGNLPLLALHCRSLENLSLKRVTYFGPNEHTEAEFTSLKTVHLEYNHFCSWCLLTKSTKLTSMTLCYYTRDEQQDCQQRCLRMNQFPNLETFNASNSLAYEGLSALLSVCPTIKMVKGVKTASLIEDIKIIYPWVQFYS